VTVEEQESPPEELPAPPRQREIKRERLELAPPAEQVKPHVRWRFWVLSGALLICLVGGYQASAPAEARSAGFALAGAIVNALAKPLEVMDP
jgi:hypothetical protein